MAFEGLLRPWSNERNRHRDEQLALLDKPAGVSTGSAAGDLEARLQAAGWDAVEVLWGIPPRASGLVLVALGDSAPQVLEAPVVAQVAAVENWSLPARGKLAWRSGRAVIHEVLRQRGSKALVEFRGSLSPAELLQALRAAGQRVIGDEPEGACATRLMLHVARWLSPFNAEAPLPVEFESWLAGAAGVEPAQFERRWLDAGLTRFGLWPHAEAFRLIGEEAGEIAGVTLDRYGPYAVLSLSNDEAWQLRAAMADCLMDHGAQAVYVKRRVRADLRRLDPEALWPSAPLRGADAPQSFVVRQGDLAFWVRLADGAATGLFLDQRDNWAKLRALVRSGSMLNLFSYTGAFSVAAAVGGAATTSVDLSRRALSNARENLELNGVSGPTQRLLKADAIQWLARAARAQRRFDWIVLDPPSFGTRARGVLDTERDYAGLVRAAAGLLEMKGRLLCVSHHRKLDMAELIETVQAACAPLGRRLRVSPWLGAWDCPTLPGIPGPKSVLVSFDES